ncbi:MAG: chemotaxis-specific protein-glutamate methyltransferase CheB [Sphingomonadales bacterium]
MIVDDSSVARAVLSRMISGQKEFEVVALAADAREALDGLRANKVDIVLLDVEMPGASGLDALPDILEAGDGAQVLIVSSNCEDGAEATVRALALGAADTLPKPGTGNFAGRFADVLAERLRKIGRARREEGGAGASGSDDLGIAAPLRSLPAERPACIALGASTGGLHALNEFLAALPAGVDVPILITQHLPPVFMPFFARQIEAASGRPARVAREGSRLKRGEVLIAPGDAHLGLRRHGSHVAATLVETPASSGCMPSVDTMLAAVADTFGKNALGVVFSGMGRDGLVGSAAVVARGGSILVQDKASSAVWGMPRAVADAGLASAVMPPIELAGCVAAAGGNAEWK